MRETFCFGTSLLVTVAHAVGIDWIKDFGKVFAVGSVAYLGRWNSFAPIKMNVLVHSDARVLDFITIKDWFDPHAWIDRQYVELVRHVMCGCWIFFGRIEPIGVFNDPAVVGLF